MQISRRKIRQQIRLKKYDYILYYLMDSKQKAMHTNGNHNAVMEDVQ